MQLAFHVLQWEQVLFIRLRKNSVESSGRLGSELITCLDELRWSPLSSHKWRRTIQHSVWSRRTIIQRTGLRIYKHFLRRTVDWDSWVFNYFKTWLQLVSHLLLREIYLRHRGSSGRSSCITVWIKSSKCFELNTSGIRVTHTSITLTDGRPLLTVKVFGKRCLITWNRCYWCRDKLSSECILLILWKS